MPVDKKDPSNPADYLVVAADYDCAPPNNRAFARTEVLKLARELRHTKVCIKIESNLRGDYALMDDIHSLGLPVMADLKLSGTPSTLMRDAHELSYFKPELLTVMCSTGRDSMRALKQALPDTEVLGVTALTHFQEIDCREVFLTSIPDTVFRLSHVCNDAGVDGIVCAPSEIGIARKVLKHGMTINAVNVRLDGIGVKGEDQNLRRMMNPARAIKLGASRVIIGRQISQSANPYDACMLALEAIASAICRPA